MMVLRRVKTPLVSMLFLAAATALAHAQVAIYGTFSPIHISGVASGHSSTGGYSTSSYWAEGFGGGVTLTALNLGLVSLGIDLRGSTRPGTQGADTVLAGLKVGFHPPLLPIKPYVQFSGGYLGTRGGVTTGAAVGSANPQHFAAYEILGGLDYSVFPLIDLRVVEVGAGHGYFFSGANNNDPNVSFITINTGIVVHF